MQIFLVRAYFNQKLNIFVQLLKNAFIEKLFILKIFVQDNSLDNY